MSAEEPRHQVAARDEQVSSPVRTLLERCCAARRWVDTMVESAPWSGADELLDASDAAFDTFERSDWLEAFAGHPRIGDLEALRSRFGAASRSRGATDPEVARSEAAGAGSGVGRTVGPVPAALDLAGREQAVTASAPEAVLRALAEGNARYDERFGHLFIVFASGKNAEEMLELLERRLDNEPERELRIAGEEQRKITRKRLSDAADEILSRAAPGVRPIIGGREDTMSAITTHVLDTARGIPAAGVLVLLQRRDGSELLEVGRGRTDQDGRANDLASDVLLPGVYRLVFGVEEYFSDLDVVPFFPQISVEFHFDDAHGHVHVPLLLSPFGYSTYRGS